MTEQKTNSVLWRFLLLNLIIWTIVPLLRQSLPMDTTEAIVWGKYSWLGTTKHPPLSGILAYMAFVLSGGKAFSMYLLSQLCVVVGITYIYKLASKLLSAQAAVLASLLQFGIIYYNFSSVEFNVNVVSLALWPMCAYYFWCAYTNNRLKDWLLFGACVALNVLNKYICALQIASFAVFVLVDKGVFKLCKNYKAYLAILLCLLFVGPHLYWLYENDFETLNYFASRSHGGKTAGLLRHFLYPIKFIGAQILFGAAAWLTYSAFHIKAAVKTSRANASAWHKMTKLFAAKNAQIKTTSLFIVVLAITPILLFACISLMSGSALKSMWGFPCLYMLGIALFYFWPIPLTAQKFSLLIKIMFAWSMLFAIIYAAQCLLTTSPRFRADCPQIVRLLEQKWQQRVPNRTLKYVGGNEWFVNMVNLYASSDIKPMVWLSPKSNPWLNQKDFEASGALLVAENMDSYRKMGEIYPISEPEIITLSYVNYFGKSKQKDLYYGFYLPEE